MFPAFCLLHSSFFIFSTKLKFAIIRYFHSFSGDVGLESRGERGGQGRRKGGDQEGKSGKGRTDRESERVERGMEEARRGEGRRNGTLY